VVTSFLLLVGLFSSFNWGSCIGGKFLYCVCIGAFGVGVFFICLSSFSSRWFVGDVFVTVFLLLSVCAFIVDELGSLYRVLVRGLELRRFLL